MPSNPKRQIPPRVYGTKINGFVPDPHRLSGKPSPNSIAKRVPFAGLLAAFVVVGAFINLECSSNKNSVFYNLFNPPPKEDCTAVIRCKDLMKNAVAVEEPAEEAEE